MTIERLQLLRNIGKFDSVNAGAQIPFTKLTLVYAENSRGKTTLAAVFRSVGTNDPQLVDERQRLGVAHAPHVVLGVASGQQIVFQDGAWSASLPDVAVFDDAFVAANVCSGIAIETSHRQNLHELILGAQGVALNTALQSHITRIEEHNRALRLKENAIPATSRGTLSVDAFCALAADPDIDAAIVVAERNLSAARSADIVFRHTGFSTFGLPSFDNVGINALLARTLPDLQTETAARVRTHLRSLGRGAEAWVGDGMGRVANSPENQPRTLCPFCAQDLGTSPLIRHYQVYFSEAYEGLKLAITQVGQGINEAHGGEAPAAFERTLRVAAQGSDFWRAFVEVPPIDVDTAAIARDWIAARDSVLTVLRAKSAAPLEAMALSSEALALVAAYEVHRSAIDNLSNALRACNAAIAIVKEQTAAANVAILATDLEQLLAVRARHNAPVAALCQDYLAEKSAKAATEEQRTQAREALDNYRQNMFPAYEAAINTYLQRFNAGFRLGAVSSVNNRGGSSCTYSVVINNVAVSLTADAGPAFRNTMSAGDRNTLALAFFFASLNQDRRLAQKIVVIDDPMTSLDEHRSLTTIQELRRMVECVSQVIVFSHSKPFLCALWDGADAAERSAIIIRRDGASSTLAVWDVREDCITEHDRRHELVSAYIQAGDPATARQVATALRPILEAFMRVAFPASFPPETLLGPFLGLCEQRLGRPNQVLAQRDISELGDLLDYANRFHHDTNPAWETAAINDLELLGFAGRTLQFATKA